MSIISDVKTWLINWLGGSNTTTASDIAAATIVGSTSTVDNSSSATTATSSQDAASIQSSVASAIDQISQGVTQVTAAAAVVQSTPDTSPIATVQSTPAPAATPKKAAPISSGFAQLVQSTTKKKK